MGGYGSGRHCGRPTADMSLRIDLAWLLRTGRAREGWMKSGSLSWSYGDEPAGSISYTADLLTPGDERLDLRYRRRVRDKWEEAQQTIRLCHTRPPFGGKRWWMICPYSGRRVGKLYKPAGGDRFAGRKAWRLTYNSQRAATDDRPFNAMTKLQKRLGSQEGWETPLMRPKGMWHRTFQRHLDRYWELDAQCSDQICLLAARLMG